MKQLHGFAYFALCGSLVLGGCGTTGQQLYLGPPQPRASVVTVNMVGFMAMNVYLDGKWVELGSGSTLLPGTYKVTALCNCAITDSSGAQGSLEKAGFTHFSFGEMPDSFTASAGDTVTYFWAGGERTMSTNTGGILHCAGFSHRVTKTNAQ